MAPRYGSERNRARLQASQVDQRDRVRRPLLRDRQRPRRLQPRPRVLRLPTVHLAARAPGTVNRQEFTAGRSRHLQRRLAEDRPAGHRQPRRRPRLCRPAATCHDHPGHGATERHTIGERRKEGPRPSRQSARESRPAPGQVPMPLGHSSAGAIRHVSDWAAVPCTRSSGSRRSS